MKIYIIGAGLAGLTAGVLLQEKGHNVKIFEKKSCVGGHCLDEERGDIYVHLYGPHFFHTNNERVWEFVNRFSEFVPCKHIVMANTNVGLFSIPICCDSKEGKWSNDMILNIVFRGYSEKHWGQSWEKLPSIIKERVPLRRCSSDKRYHVDKFQGIPRYGYRDFFENMAKNLTICFGATNEWQDGKSDLIIYTGSLDEYFGYCFGKLSYRSIEIDHRLSVCRKWPIINECQCHIRHIRSYDNSYWSLNHSGEDTIISYETSCNYVKGQNEPLYPIPFGNSFDLANKYRKLAVRDKNVKFLGRLGTYSYLDMDEVIEQVMEAL